MAGNNKPGIFSMVVVIIGLVGCAHFQAMVPQGFAEYEGRSVFKAVSPDGVVFRVRSVANEPYAELPFWREALSTRMRNAGYVLVDSSQITVADRPTSLVELAAPLGNEDQSYLIAVIFGTKRLVIVEAAGEVLKFRKSKSQIIEAIKKIRPY